MTQQQRQLLGDRIRIARLRAELSQKALDEAADVAHSHVNKLEKARLKRPSLSVVFAIAEELDLSIDWLCGRERYLLDARIDAHFADREG